MVDIFISYKREDEIERGRVSLLTAALESEGYDVFYDVQIPPGSTWEYELQSKINAAVVVLVLWSVRSVQSEWVKEEAQIAKADGKLIPVLLDPIEPPFGFSRIESADLSNWTGDSKNIEWTNLVNAIDTRIKEKAETSKLDDVNEPQTLPADHQATKKIGIGWLMSFVGMVLTGVCATYVWQRIQNSKTSNTEQPSYVIGPVSLYDFKFLPTSPATIRANTEIQISYDFTMKSGVSRHLSIEPILEGSCTGVMMGAPALEGKGSRTHAIRSNSGSGCTGDRITGVLLKLQHTTVDEELTIPLDYTIQ